MVNSRSSRRLGLLCGAILLLAGIVRLYAASGDFWLDEIWTWDIAGSLLTDWEILTGIHHDNNHYLNTWFYYLLGQNQSEIVYRIPAVLAGIGSVAVAGLIAKEQSRLAAFSAMLLTTGSCLLVHYSSEARGHSPVVFFSLLSFLLMQKSLNGAPARINFWFAFAAVLGFLSQLQFVFCYAGCLGWSLWRLSRDRKHRRILLGVNLRCHLLPTAFVLWLYVADISHMQIGGGELLSLGSVLMELLSLTVGGPQAGPLAIITSIAVVLAALYALLQLYRNGSDEWVFYLVTILIAPVLISLITRQQVFYPRYFLVCSVFVLLLVNRTLVQLYTWKPAGRILFAALLLVIMGGNAVHVERLLRLGRGQYREALMTINEQTAGPRIVIGSDHHFRNGELFKFYQTRLPQLKPIEHYALHPLPGSGAFIWPSQGTEWIILHSFERDRTPDESITDPLGNRYRLVQKYPYAGLSGWNWTVYRREVTSGE